MSNSASETANYILNGVAAQVGLSPVSNPWADTSQHFLQMRYLLQSCGEELLLAYPWSWGIGTHTIITAEGDSGDYELPEQFLQMVDQTGWDQNKNVPLIGPLSAQEWTYLEGRNLVSSTIYASFRMKKGFFCLFPQPPPAGLEVSFEYQSTFWVSDNSGNPTLQDEVRAGSDIVLFNKTLIMKFLKLRWLAAKGFDTTTPQSEFDAVFASMTGKDKGAPVLSAGRSRRGIPYLDGWYNTPDSGYGI